jgi:hypothetical protein
MVKIISMNNRRDYHHRLTETILYLDNLESDIITAMINLATKGKWKEWNEKQSEGTTFHFTEEMLRNTGDENVDALGELTDKIIAVRNRLKKVL